MIELQSHVYCTSVKCAATVYVFGGKLREPDPITIELDVSDKEDVRYWFSGDPAQGFSIADIIAAYSILARGVPPGFVPRREALAIVEDANHPIHACFRVLDERDRLHRLYFEAQAGNAKPYASEAKALSTTQTKLAASLVASGFKEAGFSWDGKACSFQFKANEEIQKLADAYESAWQFLKLPIQHPIYWMKSVLDRRDELLGYKNGKLRDLRGNKIEPMLRERRGGKTVLTPIHASQETIEKSKKYLNA